MNKKDIAKIIMKICPCFFDLKDYILDEPKYLFGKKRFQMSELVESYSIYSIPNKNVFFGYFDLPQEKMNKILVHVVSKNANPYSDDCEIGYFDVNGEYTPITCTKAWCWQQGSRLRWSTSVNDVIYYNDILDNRYVCKSYNLTNRENISYDLPLYDISHNEKWGLSIDFSRLQSYRPGYGYGRLENDGEGIVSNNGIVQLDMDSGKSTILVCLKELVDEMHGISGGHYINHVSISPNDKGFIFFHIITNNGKTEKIRLIYYDLESRSRKILEENDLASHYAWINDRTLLLTMAKKNSAICYYCTIDIVTGEKKVLNLELLSDDGHPSYLSKHMFISDTYRKSRTNYQELFIVENNVIKNTIGMFYHNPFMKGETRCDLHPRVVDSNLIIVDTICNKSIRSCCRIKLRSYGDGCD